MFKRIVLAGILALMALVAAGCGDTNSVSFEPTPVAMGVDIVIPYATSTVAPDATVAPEALYITSDGDVVLNDESVLNVQPGEEVASGDGTLYSQLRRGDAGTAVSDMQKRLAELGYYMGGISGIFDEETEDAVKKFESGYSIMQTGIATAALQEKMFSEDAMTYGSDEYNETVESYYQRLEEGDTGSNVIALQMRLQELGYPIEEITGIYDEATRKAVRKFYKAYGYKARDYAIVDLQKELYSDSARPYNAETATSQPDATIDPNDYTLRLGDTGTRVTQLQLRLKELGYLDAAEGTYDQATADAVSAFQIACRMEGDGIATEDVQKLIFGADAPAAGEVLQIYTLLQWGDSGEAVARLQERLIELGYYSGTADGVFSDDMVAVVKRFQAAAGLEETGVASVELQELIFSDNAPLSASGMTKAQEDAAAAQVVIQPLESGDEGAEVIELQHRLIELGYYSDSTDGIYGTGTEKAVERFQNALGVEADGRASSDLINIMMSQAAPPSGEKLWNDKVNYDVLAEGSSGDAVVELQRRLWELGYLNKDDIADSIGEYENFTAAAVNAAMKDMGCSLRDGRACVEFQAFLFSDVAQALVKSKQQ